MWILFLNVYPKTRGKRWLDIPSILICWLFFVVSKKLALSKRSKIDELTNLPFPLKIIIRNKKMQRQCTYFFQNLKSKEKKKIQQQMESMKIKLFY